MKLFASSAADSGATARKSIAIMQSLSAAADMAGGAVGNAINAIKGLIGAAMTFGPVGAVVAAGMLAINKAVSLWAESQQKAIDKINEWNARTRAAIERRLGDYYNGLAKELEAVSTAANRVSDSFERAAKSRAAFDAKREGMASAMGDAKIASMRRDMAADVAASPDEEKNRVAAAWRLMIAEEEAKIASRLADERASAEAHALKDAEKRLALAKEAERSAKRQEENMKGEVERAEELFGKHSKEADKARGLFDAAQRMTEAAKSKRQDLAVELKTAQGEAEINALKHANEVARAYDAAKEAGYDYDKAERDYADAWWEAEEERERAEQKAAAEEERERLNLERTVANARIRFMREELKEREKLQSNAEARLAAAQAKVQQAWGWYRDKDSLAAQIAEEKADAEARKQYEKDFEKLKSRRHDWRTADNLSLDQEAVRRVALAKEEEASAQQAVLETAENTRRAAAALEAIESEIMED